RLVQEACAEPLRPPRDPHSADVEGVHDVGSQLPDERPPGGFVAAEVERVLQLPARLRLRPIPLRRLARSRRLSRRLCRAAARSARLEGASSGAATTRDLKPSSCFHPDGLPSLRTAPRTKTS